LLGVSVLPAQHTLQCKWACLYGILGLWNMGYSVFTAYA